MNLVILSVLGYIVSAVLFMYCVIMVAGKTTDLKVWNEGVCRTTCKEWGVFWDGDAYVITSDHGDKSETYRIKWLDLQTFVVD
jgi:hypothetical protein